MNYYIELSILMLIIAISFIYSYICKIVFLSGILVNSANDLLIFVISLILSIFFGRLARNAESKNNIIIKNVSKKDGRVQFFSYLGYISFLLTYLFFDFIKYSNQLPQYGSLVGIIPFIVCIGALSLVFMSGLMVIPLLINNKKSFSDFFENSIILLIGAFFASISIPYFLLDMIARN